MQREVVAEVQEAALVQAQVAVLLLVVVLRVVRQQVLPTQLQWRVKVRLMRVVKVLSKQVVTLPEVQVTKVLRRVDNVRELH